MFASFGGEIFDHMLKHREIDKTRTRARPTEQRSLPVSSSFHLTDAGIYILYYYDHRRGHASQAAWNGS